MPTSRRNAAALIAGATVLVVASSATTAVAERLITGADIADRSITGADIKPNSVPGNRILEGSIRDFHLHRSARNAGEIYASHGTGSLDGTTSLRAPRAGAGGIPLSNTSLTTVSQLSNVNAGTYLLTVTGFMTLTSASSSTPMTAMCVIGNGTVGTEFPYYINLPGTTEPIQQTLAMSRVFTQTAKQDVYFQCQTTSAQAPPAGGSWGSVRVDFVLVPVSNAIMD